MTPFKIIVYKNQDNSYTQLGLFHFDVGRKLTLERGLTEGDSQCTPRHFH